ncbi:exocyst complex component SEC8-like isoform X1 [Olea europaea var. sylvestris]|uniref:exocyst complex component SEC8-like isoform X1 n=1 Tax=Olea europaea var. sylvestris TaxID=158386 RepID=UPI000C1D6469|nr:exocyst complex component SEC8-like isoform X1 [Olea europaea var. sylvestris]XP_022890079.1 exocyst complex component SEC8-like isoform X1 [Olea europaea var. sylvestris]XP_022890080.1 exocyst complex component SEC8-like isoform X1 [Olea europaea var. sylvestris]
MGIFDGLPISRDKSYLREELSKIDESWAAARFDSLPHVVHILTSKDRERDVQILKEQSDIIEEVVDEVVHAYHGGFNKAIQNYSQILRLFSESAQDIGVLKVDLAEAKKLLGARNKQLHQLWYRSVTLRHIISLLDQIEGIAKVPGRIEKLIAEKQFYAAVQLHVQSSLMLEREGLQTVGALQDVRSELTKLRGVLFYKVLEDLHSHLYNKGEYSSVVSSINEIDEAMPTTTAISFSMNNFQTLSRRTRLLKGDNQLGTFGAGDRFYRPSSVDGGSSFDGHDEDGATDVQDDATSDGYTTMQVNGGDTVPRDGKIVSRQIPTWLSDSTPDEFVEAMRKSDAPLHVKYLQTMVECLCMLGKVAAAGAMISQRLRPTIREIIIAKIKAKADHVNSSRPGIGQATSSMLTGLHYLKGQLESHRLPKQKRQNGITLAGTLLAVSPVSPVMSPAGTAQMVAKELLDSVLETVVRIFENHIIVGELLELKSSQQVDLNTPKVMAADINWNPDSDASHDTGGYTLGFSLTVLQSECQQLICEILRATPEAASADAAVQTARLASKAPSKDKRSEDGLTFAFRFTDATIPIPNQGSDLIRQGWSRRGPNVLQEGYGTAAVLPEQGIYLAASVYRPVVQFTDKVASMLPEKFCQLGNDGLLTFVENFVKDHFLPTMFVDYRKGVQQAISSPAAFRPRAHAAASYTPLIEKGRPVLQGLLAIDLLAKEVLGWAQAMPKFAGDLINYVQTFLERTYERCRTSYMEAVLEKQSYMLIGRHDVENLMRLDPASACFQNSLDQGIPETNASDEETTEVEMELSDILLNLRPIKQENLIRDDNKLILLASLSDSLEYVAESIERLGKSSMKDRDQLEEKRSQKPMHHSRTSSAPSKDLASFADEYRKLSIDCLKVLRIEMQLETIFHMQEMTNREYLDDQDAEEPDDFVISLTSQITRRDEEMAPFVAGAKRNYIFGGICSIAANAFMKALVDIKSINLFGVQQICRNSIALEQALAAISSIDNEAIQLRLDRIRTYYELLNMPFEALLAFIAEHEHLFTSAEYTNLLKVQVPGREIPSDAEDRVAEILPR